MLQKLGTDVTGPLSQITGRRRSILQQAQGIGYSGQNIAQQFQQLYPTSMRARASPRLRRAGQLAADHAARPCSRR